MPSSSLADLSDKVVVLTGATSGIGEATALRLATRGAKVVIAGRRQDRGDAVAAAATAAGASAAIFVQTDITKSAEVAALFERAEAEFGGVDAVFANAGALAQDNFLDSDNALELMVGVNVTGTTLVVRHGANALVRRGGGVLVLTSSIMGSFANGGVAAFGAGNGIAVYNATKSYVDGLARALHGSLPTVRTFTVAPSVYATAMSGANAASLAGLHSVLKGVPGKVDQLVQVVESLVDGTTTWAPGSLIVAEGEFTYDGRLRYAAAYAPENDGNPVLAVAPEDVRDARGRPAGLTQADVDALIKERTPEPAAVATTTE